MTDKKGEEKVVELSPEDLQSKIIINILLVGVTGIHQLL